MKIGAKKNPIRPSGRLLLTKPHVATSTRGILPQAASALRASPSSLPVPSWGPRQMALGAASQQGPGRGRRRAAELLSVSCHPGRLTNLSIYKSLSNLDSGPACSQVNRINTASRQAYARSCLVTCIVLLGAHDPGVVQMEAPPLGPDEQRASEVSHSLRARKEAQGSNPKPPLH